MTQIIVGFGIHTHSSRALEWATLLAKRTNSRVTVLNVFHPRFVEMSPQIHNELIAERQRLVEAAMSEAGHEDFDIVVRQGEPVAELLKFGELIKADLLVVGRHGSSAPGGFGEGGTAESLLRKSQLPFVVVGDDAPLPEQDSPLTFVVGVDGSKANADSVDRIAQLAKAMDARTIPVLSVSTGASTTRGHDGSRLLHQDEADAIVARLPGVGTLLTINESPVQGLLDAADDNSATLIAIGTRGHLSLADLLAGQIGRHLIAHAKRAVLISPHH